LILFLVIIGLAVMLLVVKYGPDGKGALMSL